MRKENVGERRFTRSHYRKGELKRNLLDQAKCSKNKGLQDYWVSSKREKQMQMKNSVKIIKMFFYYITGGNVYL